MIPLVETTFKNMERSDAVERLVSVETTKLERFFDRISRCRVVVEKPHRHRLSGEQYHVRIELDVPGDVITVGDAPSEHATRVLEEVERFEKRDELDTVNKYVEPAIRDAFRKAGRRLQDYARRKAGDVKHHEEMASGVVGKIGESYGFLRTDEGREIYFHRNSVLHDAFDRLHLGSAVRFVEEEGEKGTQATTVVLE